LEEQRTRSIMHISIKTHTLSSKFHSSIAKSRGT
jgi:hypothetical protein